MNTLAKVVCKGVGVTGFGFALYDAINVSKLMSRQQAEFIHQEHVENIHFKTRTTDSISYNQNNTRKKMFDKRTNNPLPTFMGSIKGGIRGFLYGLGANLPLTICSAFAIASKGFMAKVGTAGAVCCAIYNILRQGFGVGKKNPMD